MTPRPLLLLLLTLSMASAAAAIPPFVSAEYEVKEQLLDSLGAPLTGPVDLEYRIWSSGFTGELLYKQVYPAVPLGVDGDYTIRVGPFGSPESDPEGPLTSFVVAAVATDFPGVGGDRFAEITVVGEAGPRPRARLVSVPFAMRALETNRSRFAETAGDLATPGGVDASVIDSIWEHLNVDGGPPNKDPREGLQDTDGDGTPNWIDSDNDNDGINDTTELVDGTDINLVSPKLSSIAGNASTTFPATLAITGLGFLSGLSATVSGNPTTVDTLSVTSFTLDVPPLLLGTHPLVVMNANGETSNTLLITSISPAVGLPVVVPGTVVGPSPLSLRTRGTDQFLASRGTNYRSDTIDDGQLATDMIGSYAAPAGDFNWDSDGRLSLLNMRDGLFAQRIELIEDLDDDGVVVFGDRLLIDTLDEATGTATGLRLTFDAADGHVGAYVRSQLGTVEAVVFHDRDGNGDLAGTNELIIAETRGSLPGLRAAAIAWDAVGGLAYVSNESTPSPQLRLLWDRDGDGALEIATTLTTNAVTCVGADFDSSGRLAVTYGTTSEIHLLWDLNANGDPTDPGEDHIFGFPADGSCDVDASANMTVAATNGSIVLIHDRNGDEDFIDPNEVETIGGLTDSDVAIARLGDGRVIVLTEHGVTVDPVAAP
jgi:hypothetical protein